MGVDTDFPPTGWLTNRQTADRLGVGLETLTLSNFKSRDALKAVARCVRMPGGGRCNLYPEDVVERVRAGRAADDAGPTLPDGFVDKHGACAFFGVSLSVWKHWVNEGKVRCGRQVPAAKGARRTIYATADLEALRDALFGDDKLYKTPAGPYHVPAGFMRREAAWEAFGVQLSTWYRWEREGRIACGSRVAGGPKLYKVEDIERLLAENGAFSPPYDCPDRPGVVCVPLGGRAMKRRVAILDAADRAIVEGATCSWSPVAGFVQLSRGGRNTPLRRVILGVTGPEINVRHRNGDPLDCRRENLVVRSVKERVRNKGKVLTVNGRPTTSRFKGVYLEAWTGRWRAAIECDGVGIRLGRFQDEIAAAEAYDAKAAELFGEHAKLNFPDGMDARLQAESDASADSSALRAAA